MKLSLSSAILPVCDLPIAAPGSFGRKFCAWGRPRGRQCILHIIGLLIAIAASRSQAEAALSKLSACKSLCNPSDSLRMEDERVTRLLGMCGCPAHMTPLGRLPWLCPERLPRHLTKGERR